MTPMELKLELERLAEKATPGPWEADCGGTYRKDEAQVVMLGGPDEKPQRLFDTLNSDVAEIAHEADEDGTYYFDCQGADNFKLIESLVNNLPTILRALSALSGLEGARVAIAADLCATYNHVSHHQLDSSAFHNRADEIIAAWDSGKSSPDITLGKFRAIWPEAQLPADLTDNVALAKVLRTIEQKQQPSFI